MFSFEEDRTNAIATGGALPRFRSSYANFAYQATDRSLIVVWTISNHNKRPWVLDPTSSSGHGVKGLHQAPTFECQRPLGVALIACGNVRVALRCRYIRAKRKRLSVA